MARCHAALAGAGCSCVPCGMVTLIARPLYLDRFSWTLGTYVLASSDAGLLWAGPEEQRIGIPIEGIPTRGGAVNEQAAAELAEYFAGERTRFSVPLDPQGTPFRRRVWDALQDIPYGATCAYSDIARELGRPGSARAVGGAVGSNPLSIFVPCHRVIGANGTLTGYAGGLDRKRALLALEQDRIGTFTTEGDGGKSAIWGGYAAILREGEDIVAKSPSRAKGQPRSTTSGSAMIHRTGLPSSDSGR